MKEEAIKRLSSRQEEAVKVLFDRGESIEYINSIIDAPIWLISKFLINTHRKPQYNHSIHRTALYA